MNLDYLSGFLDGEGCITLTGTPTVTISQTNQAILDDIVLLTKVGKVYVTPKRDPKHKQQWCWSVTGLTAIEFLESIVDKLYLKKAEALALIESKGLFQRHKLKLPEETKVKRLELKQKLKDLKK